MNRNELIAQYVRVNRAFEKSYLPKIKKALHFKVQKVIDDLKDGGYNFAINNLSTDIGNGTLAGEIKDLYVTVGIRHARLTYRRLQVDVKKGFGFNESWAKYILDYLNRFLGEKITFEVSNTLRNALMKALTAGTMGGLSVDGMIAKLEDWPFERYQAARIVRTEVNRAANVGATAQSETSEYEEQKEWVSVEDFRTRGHKPSDHTDHVELNGVRIDSGDQFTDIRNDDKLQFPGDPNGKAESTINCRCQAVYLIKRDMNGNPILKRKTTVVIYPGQFPAGQMIAI